MLIENANSIAVDLNNIYISNLDTYRDDDDAGDFNHAILKFGSSVNLLAGQTDPGFQDGPARQASFNKPIGVASYRGNLYVIDQGNNAIRKVDARGNVTTVASQERGIKAPLDRMQCFTIDSSGTIYVAKLGGDVVRITSAGVVTEFKSLLESRITCISVVVDDSGTLYTTMGANHCIYKAKLGVDDKATILVGDEREHGTADGTGTQARFYQPHGLVIGTDGNIYVADFDNHSIRKVTLQGLVTTVAGNGNGMRRDGIRDSASFYYPIYLAFHPRDMILYILEGEDEDIAIRSIDVDTGAVATLYSNNMEEVNVDEVPVFLTPPENPPSKDIESGSGDVITSDDIEEGSVVGQIVGEGGTIAKSSYYFPTSLKNLWEQKTFKDPYTRKPIVGVNWYKAHLVPAGSLGGRRTRKVKKSKRKTFRKKRTQIRKPKKLNK